MSKKSQTRRPSRTAVETHALRAAPNWPLLAVSCVGIALTAYLSYTAFTGAAVQGCSAGGGCEAVLTSRWAKLWGLPTALWGLLAYSGLAAIAFIRRVDKHWTYAFGASLFGVCYSVYLTTVSLTILKSTCPYCLTSLALMLTALGIVVSQRPSELANRSWLRAAAGPAALAVMVIFVLHANYTAPEPEDFGPEDPAIRALAEHLTDAGAKFYGASWCPHCQEQKHLFGASAHRLPYVECSPGGRNTPQATSCNIAGIQRYPTWIINGKVSGGEVMSLAELASVSGFKGASFK